MQSIILNSNDSPLTEMVVEWLLQTVFPDNAVRRRVAEGMRPRLSTAATIDQFETLLMNWGVESFSRHQDVVHADILAAIFKHQGELRTNITAYARERNTPASGYWPDPTQSINGRSLHTELPYVTKHKFIDRKTPIASAGSCFAFEIAHVLQETGFNYVAAEPDQAVDGSYFYADQTREGMVMSSAAWGIIFNTPCFRQLAEHAFGERSLPKILFSLKAGTFSDPFRENVSFPSVEAFEHNYEHHRAASRRALTEAKVLIITLGLNEVWFFKMDGSVFARNPWRTAPSLVEHRTLTVEENVRDLERFWGILRRHNPGLKLIVTLSPVPFHATFRRETHHVVEANTHSKAVLRVAAEEFVGRYDDVYYFPSYELVTACSADAWAPDQRHVTRATVARIMDMFRQIYVIEE